MRVWTIQPRAVWDELQGSGELAADPSRGHHSDLFAAAYAWMQNQMRMRVPRYDSGPLWWGWAEKPDLRRERHVFLTGDWVRLELRLADDELLTSNRSAWDCVWEDEYCPVDAEDDREFRQRYGNGERVLGAEQPEAVQELIRHSWTRIFEPDLDAEYWHERQQVTFEWLRLSQVRRADHFQGQYLRKHLGPGAPGRDDLPPLTGYGDELRIGDRFLSRWDDSTWEGPYLLRSYEKVRRSDHLICEDAEGRLNLFNASGPGWSRSFRLLPPGGSLYGATE
jgi:hypothetical protein